MATPQLRGSVSTAQDEHASVREPHILNPNACEFLIKQHKVHAETREREDVYIDSQADYLLYEALDQVEQPIDTQLPEFPTCPGQDLVPHIYTVRRPDPSPEFKQKFPNEATLYASVIVHSLPNYLGAKLPVEHQLNIPEWRKLQPLLSDTQLVDFLEYGFPVGYTGAEPPVTGLANQSSAISAPTHVKEYIEVRHDGSIL